MSKSWGPGYFRSELFSLPPGLRTTKEWLVSVAKPEIELEIVCYRQVIARGGRQGKQSATNKTKSNFRKTLFFAMK